MSYRSTNLSDDFYAWIDERQQQLENTLTMNLPIYEAESTLQEAMAYSVLAGGKRLRPCLVYATGEFLHININILNNLAAIIEIVHAYSLIHDDLPAMDDDDLRRGKPSCHKVYGEAMAILAGDSLQALAFEWLCKLELPPNTIPQLGIVLAEAIGSSGMAQGQALDIKWTRKNDLQPTLQHLQHIHHLKTGRLFTACIDICLLVSAEKEKNSALKKFSKHIGIAFQIQDDILDVVGTEKVIGKTVGKDAESNKLTYPCLIGLDQSYQQRDHHFDEAIHALHSIDAQDSYLFQLAKHIIYADST